MTSELAVTASALTKRFGDFTAVDSIDLEVAKGSVFALLGPNGAGKTTTVRMLTTLDAPTSGTANVFGYDVVSQANDVRQRISLTGQFAALEMNLTAYENLMLMAQLRGFNKAAAKRITDQLIERFDIGEFRNKPVKSVSGGQKRRIDLAASCVIQPELLVLDEPTTGLDPRSRQTVWLTVRELVNDGVTVLLTTQYLEEADELADNVMMIDHGRAVAVGAPSELKARIGEHRVEVKTIDDSTFVDLRAKLDGQFQFDSDELKRMISIPAPNESRDLSLVNEAVIASGIAIEEIALRRPTLDDAFLALTGQSPTSESEEMN